VVDTALAIYLARRTQADDAPRAELARSPRAALSLLSTPTPAQIVKIAPKGFTIRLPQ
jgi:hypothetical protein